MFYYQTFFLLQICSLLHCSQQRPEKKFGGHRARLREKENLFPYRAQFEGHLLRLVRARAHVRAQMTRKSCAVEMRNAILRNYLNSVKDIMGIISSQKLFILSSPEQKICVLLITRLKSFLVLKNLRLPINGTNKIRKVSTNSFCCFSCYETPTNSVAPSSCI